MRLIRRLRPAPPLGDPEATIALLIGADDPEARRQLAQRLRDELAGTLDASADAAQYRLFGMEIRLSEQLRQQLGATNEMIGGLREQLLLLEAAFWERGARLTAIEDRLTAIEDNQAQMRLNQMQMQANQQRMLGQDIDASNEARSHEPG